MVTFGFSLISLTYLISFMFKNTTNAFRQVGVFYLLIGFLAPNIILGITASITSGTFLSIIKTILLLNPFFCFYSALIYVTMKYVFEELNI
jgi:hypothetical protein